MRMQVEDIVNYVHKKNINNLFELREYSSTIGEYYIEAVTFVPIVSDIVGVIIETDVFNPCLYYNESEVLETFERLNDKSRRIILLAREASNLFNEKYVRTKGDSDITSINTTS